MPSIQEYMTELHRRCDEIGSLGEKSVADGSWVEARQQTASYINAMELHLMMEEHTLFPAFEERTGISEGPTAVMREEHSQIRELLSELDQALTTEDQDSYLDVMETLLILTQQHNIKEEGMLYPMCDEELGDDAAGIIEEMQSLEQ